jgi:hypothetical protein
MGRKFNGRFARWYAASLRQVLFTAISMKGRPPGARFRAFRVLVVFRTDADRFVADDVSPIGAGEGLED